MIWFPPCRDGLEFIIPVLLAPEPGWSLPLHGRGRVKPIPGSGPTSSCPALVSGHLFWGEMRLQVPRPLCSCWRRQLCLPGAPRAPSNGAPPCPPLLGATGAGRCRTQVWGELKEDKKRCRGCRDTAQFELELSPGQTPLWYQMNPHPVTTPSLVFPFFSFGHLQIRLQSLQCSQLCCERFYFPPDYSRARMG